MPEFPLFLKLNDILFVVRKEHSLFIHPWSGQTVCFTRAGSGALRAGHVGGKQSVKAATSPPPPQTCGAPRADSHSAAMGVSQNGLSSSTVPKFWKFFQSSKISTLVITFVTKALKRWEDGAAKGKCLEKYQKRPRLSYVSGSGQRVK